MKKKNNNIALYIMGVFFLLIAGAIVFSAYSFEKETENYVKTEGTCIEIKYSRTVYDSDDGDTVYYTCTILYYADGDPYTFKIESSSIKMNSSVKLRYDPDNPRNAVKEFDYLSMSIMLIIVVILAIVMIVLPKNKNKKNNGPVQSTQFVQTQINSGTQNNYNYGYGGVVNNPQNGQENNYGGAEKDSKDDIIKYI